jgi:predicted nucleic acid-binding Zn ribbon protein
VRRRAPRPIGDALEGFTRGARPQTLLARVQGVWEDAVGPTVAAEAQPRAESSGTIVVDCSSAVWAQELELLGPDLLEQLNGSLGDPSAAPVGALRFRIARPW